MFTKKFWKATLERVIRAFATSLTSVSIIGSNIVSIDWKSQLLIAAGAAVGSLLLAIAGSQIGDPTDPSFTNKDSEPTKE
jgi:hypothetical protein